jgi:TPR repeat protein
MPEKISLEVNEEFKSIRNEVVKMASELKVEYVFQGQDDTEPSHDLGEENIDNLEERVEEDEDPFTMYKLGKKYLDEENNPEEAELWLRMAAHNGNEYAMYFLYKCYRDGRIIDKKNSKMTYLRMALDKGYDVAEYEYGKLLREKDPEEAMKYFKRAADKNNAYAAYAYGKMCADRGDINKAKIYFGRATRVKPELGFRVGMWYYYDLGNHEMGIGHLENAAKNGNVAAEEALNAINRGIDTRLAWGVMNLFRHASRVIDDRAKAHVKISPMQGVDRKLRQRIREKKEEQGLRMSM